MRISKKPIRLVKNKEPLKNLNIHPKLYNKKKIKKNKIVKKFKIFFLIGLN